MSLSLGILFLLFAGFVGIITTNQHGPRNFDDYVRIEGTVTSVQFYNTTSKQDYDIWIEGPFGEQGPYSPLFGRADDLERAQDILVEGATVEMLVDPLPSSTGRYSCAEVIVNGVTVRSVAQTAALDQENDQIGIYLALFVLVLGAAATLFGAIGLKKAAKSQKTLPPPDTPDGFYRIQ